MSQVTVHDQRAPARTLSAHAALVRQLSDRLVAAQRPLRILPAVKWDAQVERAFFARGGRELPPVTRDYYRSRPLPFDPAATLAELYALERDIRDRLGETHGAGRILVRSCREYRDVVHLLLHRGTRTFVEISERLYGRPLDAASLMAPSPTWQGATPLKHPANPPALDASEACQVLGARLRACFGEDAGVNVKLSHAITADAVAGGRSIRLRADARFTHEDLRVLEVHEAWVHLGTTLNGQAQTVCTFLSKGPPSATVTQEGLAVLTEVLAGAYHPARQRRLARRIEGIVLAARGADFRDVYRYFLDDGCEPRESYRQTVRIFRGSLPDGCGPFTKDLAYARGFALVDVQLRLALQRGSLHRVPLLFCGKTTVDDAATLAELADEGLLALPRHLPPPFADLLALRSALLGPGYRAPEAD